MIDIIKKAMICIEHRKLYLLLNQEIICYRGSKKFRADALYRERREGRSSALLSIASTQELWGIETKQ
jgi:hypothetical protein